MVQVIHKAPTVAHTKDDLLQVGRRRIGGGELDCLWKKKEREILETTVFQLWFKNEWEKQEMKNF